MGSNFSSKFQQNRSNISYGIPTATMTMTNPAFSCSSQTPNCMVYSAIGLTSTMQEGTHLVGFGSSSSVVSGMLRKQSQSQKKLVSLYPFYLLCVLVVLYCHK